MKTTSSNSPEIVIDVSAILVATTT